MAVTKPVTWSSLPISRPAKATNETISPTVSSPRPASTAPVASTATMVMVAAERCSTVSRPHQVSTGYCAASRSLITARMASDSAFSRVKLCTTVTLEMTSPTRP